MSPLGPIDRAHADVQRRVRAFAQDADPAFVLSTEASRDLDVLYQTLRTQSPEASEIPNAIEIISTLAWLHWYRALASPPGTDEGDLDMAIDVFRRLPEMEGISTPTPLRPLLKSGLDLKGGSVRLAQRAVKMLRDIEAGEVPATALDPVVDLFALVVAVIRDDDPNRWITLNNLAAARDALYKREGTIASLDTAIEAMKLAAASASGPEQVHLLSLIGERLYARFQHSGAVEDLDNCIETYQDVRALTSQDNPDSSDLLSHLSAALGSRFDRTGSEADLAAAVEMSRAAVEAPSSVQSKYALHLSNYAVVLMSRYEHAGARGDLDTAITALRNAVNTADPDDSNRGGYLTNLGMALHVRFGLSKDSADLDSAIEACRAAVLTTPDDKYYQCGRLSNLGMVLADRWRRSKSDQDLQAAVEALENALRLTPSDHPKRGAYLSNFASVLLDQSEVSKTEDDLEIAIRVSNAALDETSTEYPGRAKIAMQLANALIGRALSSGMVSDLYHVMVALRVAAHCSSAAVPDRILASKLWAESAVVLDRESVTAQEEKSSGLAGYEMAISLLPLLAWPGTDRASRERRLMMQVGVATDAASAALAAKQPDRAIMWLEQGRAVLWSRTLEVNADIEAVRSVDPDLAEHIDRIRSELAGLSEPILPADSKINHSPVAL
jgi:tetratricopeptide (TPR) repeat protein